MNELDDIRTRLHACFNEMLSMEGARDHPLIKTLLAPKLKARIDEDPRGMLAIMERLDDIIHKHLEE